MLFFFFILFLLLSSIRYAFSSCSPAFTFYSFCSTPFFHLLPLSFSTRSVPLFHVLQLSLSTPSVLRLFFIFFRFHFLLILFLFSLLLLTLFLFVPSRLLLMIHLVSFIRPSRPTHNRHSDTTSDPLPPSPLLSSLLPSPPSYMKPRSHSPFHNLIHFSSLPTFSLVPFAFLPAINRHSFPPFFLLFPPLSLCFIPFRVPHLVCSPLLPLVRRAEY